MKRIALLLTVMFGLFMMPASAEETTPYLIHTSEDKIEQIQQLFPNYTTSFETIAMLEVHLTEGEKHLLQTEFPDAELYPVQNYEAAEVTKKAVDRHELIHTTPSITSPYTGKNVKVAILDTGISVNHPHLKVKGGTCTVAEHCPPLYPFDDDNGHGTHVAGIIAAKNAAGNEHGIAPNVDLYAIKSFNWSGKGKTTQIVEGIEWAILNEIDILNLSLETNMNDYPLELILKKAYENGMLIIGSAGNQGSGALDIDSVQYPAKYPSVIAVSAVKMDKTRVKLSSIGPEVELAAPGQGIVSTYPIELDYFDGKQDGYIEMTGTSMAAPHVAGIAALYKERFPGISNVALRDLLVTTAEDLGPVGRDQEFGYGLVQYKQKISGFPYLNIEEDDGQVHLSIEYYDKASNAKVTLDGQQLSLSESGEAELYLLGGTYQFEFTYVDDADAVNSEKVSLIVTSPKFSDVNPKNWYASHLAYLTREEKMYGFKDGTFKPTQEITRAEAVALLGRVLELDGKKRKTIFGDVGAGNFASGYIQSAYDREIVSGFLDNTFRPSQSVTRAEMAILIANAFDLTYNPAVPMKFDDVTENMASYDAVRALMQNGITQGYPDGSFQPNTYMTRSTFSVFLATATRPDLF